MFLRQITRQAPRITKFLRPATALACRTMSTTAGASLAELAAESPHVDVVRYEHKNLKLTLKGVDYNADALAAGLLDCGLVPGDVVLSWLPSHFAEQVCVRVVMCFVK
jgi:non-ribosomal peptide synthetase component E (peptide arylation enzyme)